MLKTISREDVTKLLRKWQSGQLSAVEVHEWAESLYQNDEVEYLDWEGNDERSVTNEVIAALDMMDMNLTTEEDIPAFIEFLKAPNGEFDSSYRKLMKILGGINISSRKEKLKDAPLYSPFCQKQ